MDKDLNRALDQLVNTLSDTAEIAKSQKMEDLERACLNFETCLRCGVISSAAKSLDLCLDLASKLQGLKIKEEFLNKQKMKDFVKTD